MSLPRENLLEADDFIENPFSLYKREMEGDAFCLDHKTAKGK